MTKKTLSLPTTPEQDALEAVALAWKTVKGRRRQAQKVLLAAKKILWDASEKHLQAKAEYNQVMVDWNEVRDNYFELRGEVHLISRQRAIRNAKP